MFRPKITRKRLAVTAAGLVVLAGTAIGVTATSGNPGRPTAARSVVKVRAAALPAAELSSRWTDLVAGPTVDSASGGGAAVTAYLTAHEWRWVVDREPSTLDDPTGQPQVEQIANGAFAAYVATATPVGTVVTVAPTGTTVDRSGVIEIPYDSSPNAATYPPGYFARLTGIPVVPNGNGAAEPTVSLTDPTVLSASPTGWQVRFDTASSVCVSARVPLQPCHFAVTNNPAPTAAPGSGQSQGGQVAGTLTASVTPLPGGGLRISTGPAGITLTLTPACVGHEAGCFTTFPPAVALPPSPTPPATFTPLWPS